MIAVKRIADDLINLLFPLLCNACGEHLHYGEKEICSHCLYDLPYTDFHLHAHNPVAQQFWARVPCNAAMAMLYFKKGNKVQNLMHSLKYKGKTDLGRILGNLMGEKLRSSKAYEGIDVIIPVPLHAKKEKLRGYNQSLFIANGIAEVLGIPVKNANLLRRKATASQTKKSRYTRYENMESVFEVWQPEELKDKHILLIDDVITTGATLEACSNALLNVGIKKLSIATLAFAE